MKLFSPEIKCEKGPNSNLVQARTIQAREMRLFNDLGCVKSLISLKTTKSSL